MKTVTLQNLIINSGLSTSMPVKKVKKTVPAAAAAATTASPAGPIKAAPIAASTSISDFTASIETSISSYFTEQTQKTTLIDTFLAFLVVVALIQFVFAILVGNFPFNAFLGGFISTVGQFVLTVSLRLQSNSSNYKLFSKISPERALADYIFASLILHFIIYHFIN